MNSQIQRRAGIICIGLAFLFSIFSGRLIYLQVGKHEEFSREAADTTAEKKVARAERGKITDSRGEVLADNIPIYTVVVDGTLVSDRSRVAETLSRYLEIPVEQVAERIASTRPYIVVKNRVAAATVDALRANLEEQRLRGVFYQHDPMRIYPNENMLGHVLGFLNHEGRGIQGIEMMMDPYLRGEDGFIYTERDRTGREIVAYRGMERPAKNGMTVHLTVDMNLQAVLERELDTAYQQLNPNMMTAVFVNPQTGEILAMATRPNFNPNSPGLAPVETTKNRAIIDMFEPGSTFKIVTISAALNEHSVKEDTKFFCENGRFAYAGKILRDAHGYGTLNVHDILVKSSNIGSAKVAMHIGADTLYEYIRRFGFGERTGIGLPGEIKGLVHPRDKWSGLSITRIPMGHEVSVTPLQTVMAMSVIANGGNMMLPQIVRSVDDEHGREVVAFRPQIVRRVVSKETAAQVNSALTEVVSSRGTAPLAKIAGFPVAGKTGTAQRVDPKGGYTPGQYVVSFAGYFPASNPQVAGIVLVDNPRTPGTSVYGGTIAAPIFARIGEGFVRQLDLVPESEQPNGATIAYVPFDPNVN